MGRIINAIVRLIQAGRQAYARKWVFLWLFVIVFLGNVYILAELDLLPEIKKTSLSPEITLVDEKPDVTAPAVIEMPVRIAIPKINMSVMITNPTTTSIPVLDGELLKGAVRYPTSAKLGEDGNVVLFGHSSYLPVVGNQAYKSFNGIQKLSVGDTVIVSSSNTAYTYRVRSVVKEVSDDNTAIPLSIAGKALTLVTCNSFGAKEDRFVVTADFVESHLISN